MQQVKTLKCIFILIILISLVAAECVEPLDASEVKWRIHQWYEERYNALVYESVFGNGDFEESGYATTGVHSKNPEGEEVTYELYIDGELRDSCKIRYEGECELVPVLEEGEAEGLYSLYSGGIYGGESRVTLEITSKKPGYDLSVDYLSPELELFCGVPTTFQSNIYNLGDSKITEPFKVKVELSGEKYEGEISGIDACGFAEIIVHGVVFDKEDGCGQYSKDSIWTTGKITVDSEEEIEEYDDANNQFDGGQYAIPLHNGKDIIVSEVVLPAEVVKGVPFEVGYSISNVGTEDVDSQFYVDLRYSCHKMEGELDRVLVQDLKAGSTKTFHKTVTLEKDCCQIIVNADSENEIEEYRIYNAKEPFESNNDQMNPRILCQNSKGGVLVINGNEEYSYAGDEPPINNETEKIGLCKNVSCKDYCGGKTLYSNGKCNEDTGKCEYLSKQCENGCDPKSAGCIQLIGTVDFDVFIEGYEDAVGSGEDSVTVTARLFEEGATSIAPIEGAKVIFEVSAPEGSGAFKKYGGKMTIEGTTNSNGEANANIEIPALEEFYPGSRKDTYIKLNVKASKHSDGLDFDYEDGPYTIKVLSPAVSIEKITISPNPAKAYETHDVKIKTSDAYAGGPAHYTVTVTQGILSFEKTRGEPGGGIAFDKSGTEAHVNWEAPERGLTPYEFDYAKELKEINRDYGIGAGSSAIGIAFPILKSGETVYGMYGDAKNIVGEIGQLDESLSAEEGAWRILDATVSDVKLMIGAVNLVVGVSPGVGSAAVGFGEDTFIYGLERGQAVIKENAAEARWEETETRKIDQMIRVDVVDSEGYSDTDFLIYEMEYLWEKGVAE